MTKRKEWKKLLKQRLEQDNATLIKLTMKDKEGNEIDLGTDLDSIKIRRGDKCIIECSCGRICNAKDVRQIIKIDALCEFCRHPGERWDNRSLWDFYNEHKGEFNGEGEEYNWWNKVYKFYVVALQSYRKTHPHEVLPFLSIVQSRKAGGKNLWREALEVYESEGVKGLTKKNLNKKKRNFYTHIKGKIKKTGTEYPNYPCIAVCEKIKEFFPEKCKNILSERNEYLKKTFPRECLCFEELCELHIKPILPKLLQNNSLDGFLLTAELFHNNGYSSIVTTWSKFGKGIHDVRKICGTKPCCDIHFQDLYGFTHRSGNEMRIYNFLYKCKSEVKSPDNPYPQDFKNETGRNFKDDGKFYSPNEQRWITIEAWGDNNNKGNKRTNSEEYKEHKELKQKYWKKNPGQCLEIEYEPNKHKLEDILLSKFKPHFGEKLENGKFGDIKLKILSPDELVNCLDYNEEQKVLEYLEEKIYINKDGKTIVPLLNDIPSHMKYVISSNGGMENWYKKLDTKRNPNQVQLSKIYKKQKYSVSGKKSQKTWKNKSKEEMKSYSDKISKQRKDSGCAKGKNNPCYGLKGKDHPSYGHHPHYDYKKKFIPLMIDCLTQHNCRYINGSVWAKWAQKNEHNPEFWFNPGQYNPWKESGFEGVLQETYDYAEENGINIRIDFMVVDKIPNALSCEKNREIYMNFVREHHRKPVEMRDEAKLAVWFRDVNKYISQDNHQTYWDETKKILDEMFDEEKENMINFQFNKLKTQIKPLYKLAVIDGKRVITEEQIGWQVKLKNEYIKGSCRFSTSKSACFKNRCNTIEECKLEVENWIDSHKKNLLDNYKSIIHTNSGSSQHS